MDINTAPQNTFGQRINRWFGLFAVQMVLWFGLLLIFPLLFSAGNSYLAEMLWALPLWGSFVITYIVISRKERASNVRLEAVNVNNASD